jgi:hypothetical protein
MATTGDERPRRKRLIVELNDRTDGLLTKLTEVEDMNKTTIVNRAVQVYDLITETQRSGGTIYIQEAGSDDLLRMRVL